ncbi:MAG: tRNA-dihydrouridine synthase family protein [Candidatus Woesearchaeota archaeon]
MKFKYMSAPIEDVSDNAFRTLCYRHGADLTFTELTRVEGLARNNASTWSRLQFNDNTPTVIQLLGGKEEHFSKFLTMFKPHESFRGFNLNLGCPSPQVTSLGQGCALMKRINKVKKIVDIFKKENYPISIKMRLGLNNFEKEAKVYLNLIQNVDADFFVVHTRVGSESYDAVPDYSVLPKCVESGKEIIANGSIDTLEKIKMLKDMGVSGAMIGRSAVKNPAIFDMLKGKKTPSIEELKKEYLELSDKYEPAFKYRKNVLKHLN